MHIANRVLEYISTADKLINSDEYEYYNWRFGKIAYKKTGEGSPLLLVHNLNVCSTSYEMEKQYRGTCQIPYCIYN